MVSGAATATPGSLRIASYWPSVMPLERPSSAAGFAVHPPESPAPPEFGAPTMMSKDRAAPVPGTLPVSCTDAGAEVPTIRTAAATATASAPHVTLIHHQ